ncbi:nicotianamine synthase [Nocardiopsis sp. HNM0947]|uniref:Nicotianamine synthase n=1 Tax=Nocardiopsis coralli TaxID=2772213 RepID=A0ABR9PCK9_9ACTN|nr:nicotianamine synthase family protein [Nocardiopsis coralli]MBE3001579.1 nicotianamine synthase [Nocardiopsis coralli]
MPVTETPTRDRAPARKPTPPDLLADLRALEAQLSAADLRPCPEVDAAFGHLVDLCTVVDDHLTEQLMAAPAVDTLLDSLRTVSARGEGELERAWARRVIAADDPWAELARFPYLDNYRRLVRFELAGLDAVGAEHPRSAVVLGAGPLPLTALVLAQDHGVHVTAVDNDAEACDLASALHEALGTQVHTVCTDAASAVDLPATASCDAVLLAALVGTDSGAKRTITRALSTAMRPDALLITRSAHRLRTALYPSVSPDDLCGFTPLVEMHPCDDVVNSALIARPVE